MLRWPIGHDSRYGRWSTTKPGGEKQRSHSRIEAAREASPRRERRVGISSILRHAGCPSRAWRGYYREASRKTLLNRRAEPLGQIAPGRPGNEARFRGAAGPQIWSKWRGRELVVDRLLMPRQRYLALAALHKIVGTGRAIGCSQSGQAGLLPLGGKLSFDGKREVTPSDARASATARRVKMNRQ